MRSQKAVCRGQGDHHRDHSCRQEPELRLGLLSGGFFGLAAREQDYFRLSFSSRFAQSHLADQYLYLDVGPATLVGNLQGT